MSRDKPIPIPIPTLGLLKAVDREHIPPQGLAEAENVILRDRDFQVRPGLTPFGDNTGQRFTGIVHYDHGDGSLRTVMATIQGWRTFNYSTRVWTPITGPALTGSVEQQVFRVFQKSGQTFLLGVNWKDPPKKWDGVSAGYLNIAGSPPIARTMMILNNRLLMGNLRTGSVISPVATDISAFNDFDSGWGTISVPLLADTPGEIVIMEEMGNAVGAIIKTDACYRATAQSGVDPVRYDYIAVPKDEGAAATLGYCRKSDGTIVYLALNGKLKNFDLNSVFDFGSDNLRVQIAETMDFSSIGRSWMAYDSVFGEILVVYPTRGGSGEPDMGLVIKERTGAIYPFRWPGRKFTAGTFGRLSQLLTFDDMKVPFSSVTKTFAELAQGNIIRRVLSGDNTGQAYSFNGETDNGAAIPAFAETGLNPLGTGTTLKTVKQLEHRFKRPPKSQPVNISIGVSKNGEERVLSAPKAIDIGGPGNKTIFTGHRTTSKYLSMRIDVSATQNVVWRGSFVDVAQRGSWR